MSAPQFNKEVSPNRWYLLTYQSNEILNEKTHHQVKKDIAKVLVDKFPIKDLHSYIHGNIAFSINTLAPISILDKLINQIKEPLATYSPPLLFSINLISKNDDNKQFLYIYGDDTMDKNFKELIKEFFPIKTTL
ncbi:MAG TPA: hypothetical protein VFM99_10155 [Chitinophagales bacterium]|nr:hypothetical protein [Chitinophagales bacterium]